MNYEVIGSYLLVTSVGERNTFQAVMDATKKLYSIIEKTKRNLGLLDYRKIFYNLPQTDAFNIIRLYELKMPLIANIKLASLVIQENVNISQIWKVKRIPF